MVLVGCGESTAPARSKPESTTVNMLDTSIQNKASGSSIWSIIEPDDLFAEQNVKQIEAVKQRILEDADVNEKGGSLGQTPLHWAVSNSQKEVVELLLSKGAEVNANNGLGA